MIRFGGEPGSTYYVVYDNGAATPLFWNALTAAYEAYNAANWTDTKYCVDATEDGPGMFVSSVPAGAVNAWVFLQAGGSPATSDERWTAGDVTALTDIATNSSTAATQATAAASSAASADNKGTLILAAISAAVTAITSAITASALTVTGIAAAVWSYAVRRTTSGQADAAPSITGGVEEIVRGDSYLFADGNHKVLTKLEGQAWPTTLTGTITFTARRNADKATVTSGDSTSFTTACTIIQATDSGGVLQSVRYDLLAAATALASTGTGAYDWDVQMGNGSSRITLRTGILNVLPQQTTT